ncbi:MAG: PTS system permease (IIAMan), nitrogen regulatory IIA protein, partial [uncultured Sphingomonadaceae bacterium]
DWIGVGDARPARARVRRRHGACRGAAGGGGRDLHRTRRRHGSAARRHRAGDRRDQPRRGRDHADRSVRGDAVQPRHLADEVERCRGDRGRQPADADPAGRRAPDEADQGRRRRPAGGGTQIYIGRVRGARRGGGL